MPELFEVVALNEDGLDKAPHPTVPYYIHAAEGDYIYRDTQIGTVLLKETKKLPLGRIGYAQGVFTWKGEKIPGKIISQAHDFFKRTFEKHHAEAEVLITMHNETGEYRLFVPYQRVNHSGVKSVYEPTHVSKDYTVVGTLHSHCDFTAFHSGTDSGDASDMDGVHFTIGFVNRDVPQIVAMVTMNGKEFHYKDPSEIAEIEFGTETAPAWWDNYVYPADSPSAKPKSLRSITQAHWDQFRGIVLAKPKHTTQPTPIMRGPDQRPNGWISPYGGYQPQRSGDRWVPPTKKPEKTKMTDIRQYSRSRMLQDDWTDDSDWRDLLFESGLLRESVEFNREKHSSKKTGIPELDQINKAMDAAEASGVFTDADWHVVKASDMDEVGFWQEFFAQRMKALAEVMEILDLEVKYDIVTKGASK
jgi:hypothetical protein